MQHVRSDGSHISIVSIVDTSRSSFLAADVSAFSGNPTNIGVDFSGLAAGSTAISEAALDLAGQMGQAQSLASSTGASPSLGGSALVETMSAIFHVHFICTSTLELVRSVELDPYPLFMAPYMGDLSGPRSMELGAAAPAALGAQRRWISELASGRSRGLVDLARIRGRPMAALAVAPHMVLLIDLTTGIPMEHIPLSLMKRASWSSPPAPPALPLSLPDFFPPFLTPDVHRPIRSPPFPCPGSCLRIGPQHMIASLACASSHRTPLAW